jgi:hypothetical protein
MNLRHRKKAIGDTMTTNDASYHMKNIDTYTLISILKIIREIRHNSKHESFYYLVREYTTLIILLGYNQ